VTLPLALPMSAPEGASLRSRAVRAVAWGYGGSLARMVTQIGAQAVLARLLGPQEFGVFSALMLLIGVSVLAADLVSAPVIQAPVLDAATVRFACALQWLGSALVALLSLACLPWYTSAFPQAEGLGWSLVMVAVGIFVTGWGGVSLSLLRRDLRYREIQLSQLGGYVGGYLLIAVPLAWAGLRSHHVLVVAWLAQSAISTALQYAWARHPIAASWRFEGWRRFLRYGGEVSVGNVANWFSTSIDRLLVARHATPVDIGYYNSMLNLMSTPVTQISSSLNTVAFSVSAQSDAAALRRGTRVYLHASTLLFGLLYAVFASAPELWVQLLYGARWTAGAVYLTPFCIAAVSFGLAAAANAVLTSGGRAGASAASQLATAASVAVIVWMLIERSTLWAAWGVAAVYAMRALVLAALALHRVSEGVFTLLRIVGLPILLAVTQVAMARVATNWAQGVWVVGFTPVSALITFAALVVMIVSIVVFRKVLVPSESRDFVEFILRRLSSYTNRRHKY